MADTFALTQSSNLPSLSTEIQRYPRSTPKRYEDTRAAIIQDFTHRRILGFGSEIQRKAQEQREQEKLEFLHQAEEEVWNRAEIIKKDALKKQKEELKKQHQKTVKKLYKELETTVKEEALKVEMAMQALAIEQVIEERVKGEEALKKAVLEACENAAKEKREALSALRSHERRVAEAFVTNLMEKHTKEIGRMEAGAKAELKEALSKLEKVKDIEKIKAVKEARLEEQSVAAKNLVECKQYYLNELTIWEEKFSEKTKEIQQLLQKIDKMACIKKAVEKSLIDTRQDYVDYLERTSCLNKEQTEVLMPSLYLQDVENKASLEYDKNHPQDFCFTQKTNHQHVT